MHWIIARILIGVSANGNSAQPIGGSNDLRSASFKRLMELMAAGQQKLEAIKLHRKLTGQALKESKDQVEKYWPTLSKHYSPAEVDAAYDKQFPSTATK